MKPNLLILGLLIVIAAALAGCDNAPPLEVATLAPTPTGTPVPFPTARPTNTPQPTPTLTPTPAPQLIQLTTDGCCVNPGWSPDSRRVLYIDRPAANAEIGYYAIDVTNDTHLPEFAGRVGLYSPDRSVAAFAEGANTVVERLNSGELWVVPNNGQAVEFAPDNQHVAWEIEAITGPYDQRQTEVFVAAIGDTKGERVARLYGGGLIGWLPRGLSVMFLGRPSLDVRERTLTVLDLRANVAVDLVTAERIGGVTASTDGSHVAYFISFNEDEERNGLWVQRADGSPPRKIDLWGAYQWRDGAHLLVIPARPSAEAAFEVLEVDADTGEVRPLTSAAVTPLYIANGDWRVSPDGKSIVYVNSADRNLWLLKLP